MEPCPTPVDFERRATGVMRPEEGGRFDQHLTACRRCHAAYQSLLKDQRFLAEAKLILGQSDADETLAVTPAPGAGPGGLAANTAVLEAISGGLPPVARDYLPRIEGYEVIRIIGRGGMGVVYEAVQKKLSRRVALKLLPALVSSAHPDIVTRFKREATAAAKLHHTNIIPIYDFGESRDGYYYAMELIAGQSLSVLIKRFSAVDAPMASATALATVLHQAESDSQSADAVPAEPSSSGIGTSATGRGRPYYRQVARWIADVADALHYSHLHGLVHRDIKPGNLMVCPDGRIVVLDFGLVKGAEDHSVTMTGSLVGTYRYMSPEQVGAKRIVIDARTDIYSLGATLYELLTFQPAFGALEQSELLSHILFKDPTPPRKTVPAVPVDLQTICLKALEKAPNARYQTARAMAEDLRQYMSDLPIVARPLGVAGRSAKYLRRHRAATAMVVSLLLLAVAVTVALWNRGRRIQERQERLDALVIQGVAHLKAEDWSFAEFAFNEILKLDPSNFRALVNLATAKKDQYYLRQDKTLLEEADRLITRALDTHPNRIEPWNLRGIIRRTQGKLDEAVEAHETAKGLNPAYYPTWNNLGAVYAMKGDLVEVERCLQEAARLPDGCKAVLTWRHLASVHMQLGRSEALDDVAKALDVNGKDVATLLLRARLQLQTPASDAAKEALKSATFADSLVEIEQHEAGLSGQPSVLRAWVKRVLAMAQLQNREWDDAIAAAESALSFKDSTPAYARLILAIAESHRGQTEVARRHYDDAVKAWPAAWEAAGFKAQLEGKVLWLDSLAELTRLRREAEALLAK